MQSGERHFSEQLQRVCEELLAHRELHFFGLTGPTCSGKTTAAKLLTHAFEADGRRVHVISVDDFYYDKTHLLELTRKKGLDTLDYDSEDTIDIDLFGACVESLRAHRSTQLPRFNFHTGLREAGERIVPSDEDVFLFEGIQILYPRVDEILRSDSYRCIRIEPLSAVEVGGVCYVPNELRLMRRLVRDFRFRSTSPEFTLMLWQSVRSNEDASIFPNVHRCHYSIDSTMPYEVGILKPYLEEILPLVPQNDPQICVAKGILERMKSVSPINADLICENSLYKEFI